MTVLSLVVALVTVWNLRMTGITIANSASCGSEEHQHSEDCLQEDVAICGNEEHLHSTGCYSNPQADTETPLDWQSLFEDYPYTGVVREDLVGIAKTQVGYAESQLNFEVSDAGERKGYTRYGAWYGAPYQDWSAMFVSFCLDYAEADSDAFPNSSGASSMAELWKAKDRFIPAGDYIPRSGDLVFFNNNTVGIVTEVYNATFYMICGDLRDAVTGETMPLNDASIVGWGSTETFAEETPQEQTEPVTEETVLSAGDMPDLSNGPIFFITEGGQEHEQLQGFFSLASARSMIELIPYLDANGGSYFYTLLDANGNELDTDENGNHIVEANKRYKLTITFNSPKGFLPGTYQYQIPNGLLVDGGKGEFILNDNTNVGSWEVTDTGLITMTFNDNMKSRTDITISSTLGIHFQEQDEPLDFDGCITVKVEPPVQQRFPTELSKWGTPNADADKLNWYVLIKGHADSQIPGSILADQVTLPDWGKPHSYTDSDIAAGITISATAADGSWHTWTVTTDDPHLIWDESGWSYKIPQTANCVHCGQLELGNEGWEYMVTYTSTPTPLNMPGAFAYENKVTVDGQTAMGWNQFTHGEIDAEIVKDGSFVSDASGGGFLWEFQAAIPGRPEGQRAQYAWFIMDEMKLLDENGTSLRKVHNDVNLSKVTADYNGTTIQIPQVQDATDQDMFAWDVVWTSDGVASTRTINLLCRCRCTSESCHWEGCEEYWVKYDDGTSAQTGFCQCWTENQNVTFTFVYKTQDVSMVADYGALGYKLNNLAQLYYMTDGDTSIQVDYDDATVSIPNLFQKQLTQEFNGYTAHYRVTVNEAKLVLTDGTPLHIHDVMTDTLAYISGSLVITTENADGHKSTLRQGVDFTVTYDGTGEQTDSAGQKVHVLDIMILNPQPVMYILDYDTTLIMPEHVSGAIKYSNSANITLWGEKVAHDAVGKVYADINIGAKSFSLDSVKTCAVTGKPLSCATLGLYNEQNGLITAGITGSDGKFTFQTNIVEGIILREHERYYLQEIQAPTAYRLDDTKNWFCFCNTENDTCSECSKLLADVDGLRIPLQEIGIIEIVNHPATVVLPSTGGIGIPIYVLCGLTLVLGPLVYGFSLRCRYGRRFKQ